MAPQVAADLSQRPRVLHVEDEPAIQSVVALALRQRNIDVQTACDGLEAWDVISVDLKRVDLVITDNQMPRISGLELIQLLREAGFPGKVIFFSSTLGTRDAEALARLNVDAIIEKGTHLAQLLAEIDRVMGWS